MNYTPTTATIRAEYAGRFEAWEMTLAEEEAARAEGVVEFDRWLSAHDREVRAQALREAASAPIPRAALNTRNNGLRQWLRARADQIERGANDAPVAPT